MFQNLYLVQLEKASIFFHTEAFDMRKSSFRFCSVCIDIKTNLYYLFNRAKSITREAEDCSFIFRLIENATG